MNLDALRLQRSQQLRLIARTRIVAGKNVSSGSFILRLSDRAFALQIKVLEKEFAVVAEVIERSQQRGLLDSYCCCAATIWLSAAADSA